MKSPLYLIVCAILGLFANRAPAAETTYTVRVALAIPFDFRETGSHYKIPLLNENTPITVQVGAKPGADMLQKVQEQSKKVLGETFSDIPDFIDQIIPLTTEQIADPKSPNTYLSLWLAPAVPQTKKGGKWYTLGHIKGVTDNTEMLNKLFGVNLLEKLTAKVDTYMKTAPLFRYVFLFAQNAKNELVVAAIQNKIENPQDLVLGSNTGDYTTFGLKETDVVKLSPVVDRAWLPEFLWFHPEGSKETEEFAFPHYYATAVPAEVLSAKNPKLKFERIADIPKTDALLDVKCTALPNVRPEESLEARAGYEISRLFNKRYLEPFANSLYQLAKAN